MRLKPEDRLQANCVQWFKLQYPRLLIYSIPNGANKSKVGRMIFKMTGLLSGVPDLYISKPRGPHCGLYIEIKIPGKKPSANQASVMAQLKEENYQVEVCYDLDGFIKTVTKYLNLGEHKYEPNNHGK